MKNILTYSGLNTFRNCSCKYRLRYMDGLTPRDKSESLAFGSVIHNALELSIDKENVRHLQLAYCLIAHKAQGSEFPCVIVLCHKSHFFADRNWLYTAVTRASKTCILMGDAWGLRHAAGKNLTIERRTLLSKWSVEPAEVSA